MNADYQRNTPVVGISANARDANSCLAEAYYHAVIKAGGIPLILPITTDRAVLSQMLDRIDGLLMSGGGDIDPSYFGETPIPQMDEFNSERDSYDVALIRLAANRQMPILGVCRGMQIINVVFGGDIYQDIATQYATESLVHSQKEPRHQCTHAVTVKRDSKLADILGVSQLEVNSIHHQAVRRIAPGFSATAFSPDGICEGIEADHYHIIGVQWHPEHLAIADKAEHLRLFSWLIKRSSLFAQVRLLHEKIISIDSHCDTPMVYSEGMNLGERTTGSKVDFIKMREGLLDTTCMVAYIPQKELDAKTTEQATQLAKDTLQLIHTQVSNNKEIATLVLSEEDILRAKKENKVGVMPAIENGYAIGDNLDLLSQFYDQGVRYMTLCHNGDNLICDSAMNSKQRNNGLSPFGRQVVAEMNRLGMLIDISHAGEKSFWDIMETSTQPVIATHSSVRSLCDHPRNLTDEQLKALANKGGVCQICLYSYFLTKSKTASVADAVAHIDHIVRLVGIDFVGIGSDFDGGGELQGCQAANEFPALTMALLEIGYSHEAIAKIWGGNFLRLLKQIQSV